MQLRYITTTYEDNKKAITEENIEFCPDKGRENELINLYPQVTYQSFEGFGGAITDSAAYVFSLMDEKAQAEVLKQYFGTGNMQYNMVRIPIDSCDFSLEHYEADSEEADENFEHFSFDRVEKYIIPFLDAAEKEYGKKLEIMLSPWSPPAYMKTNGERNHGGRLKPEYAARWAGYICRYIKEYRSRGYLVTRLTVQNEPKAVQPWDSCIYTAQEEKAFITDYLWPEMVKQGMDDIKLYIWDHNKERAFEWAEDIFDETTAKMIDGLAFHWYSGDHFEALRMIRERFPDKKLLLSEACIEYSKFSAKDYLKNAQKYAHDMIGNLNNGMNSFMDWNLLLDEQGGPNHVKNFCDAPFLYDTKKEMLKETNILGYLWHFAHFIEKGAVRIGVTNYSEQLQVTAFRKNDNIAVIILNTSDEELPVYIRIKDTCAGVVVKPRSISSGVIK